MGSAPRLLAIFRHVPDHVAKSLVERHALQALATSQRLGLRRHASRHLLPHAWEMRANLSAYDALHVAQPA
jgi:predicted nucleic acid-binding protein